MRNLGFVWGIISCKILANSLTVFKVNRKMYNLGKSLMNWKAEISLSSYRTANVAAHFIFGYLIPLVFQLEGGFIAGLFTYLQIYVLN